MDNQFRSLNLAKKALKRIKYLTPSHEVKFCHVCGTHEWVITHYGIRSLLPNKIDVIAGPGCPVCIVPAKEIDEAVWLALNKATVLTFGDMIRVPGSKISLAQAKALGGKVKIVYSVKDAVEIAKQKPNEEFVFFAIGFETTAPSTALEAVRNPPKNLSFLISHRLIPPVMELLLGIGDLHIDGFIAPGHVSTIIGLKPYEVFPKVYKMPTVIAGFEPLDVLFALIILLKQISHGEAKLENEYSRSVKWNGNLKAQKLINEVFNVTDGFWRGLGKVPASALKLKEKYSSLDAKLKYEIKLNSPSKDLLPGCSCHLVIIGKIKPTECPLFMKACTPQTPKGSCMVSMEGTCAIWAKHGASTKKVEN
ncbi:MAG: hydrogenase formation protein HypD [Candidatus Bathyarchaeia archaeon]